MASSDSLQVIDQMLWDLMTKDNVPFGGKIKMILGVDTPNRTFNKHLLYNTIWQNISIIFFITSKYKYISIGNYTVVRYFIHSFDSL